ESADSSTSVLVELTLCTQLFLFQAEDGIRFPLVTGVQTCALPICRRRQHPPGGRPEPAARGPQDAAGAAHRSAGHRRGQQRRGRSEERRVGKECRKRWALGAVKEY